MSYQVHQISTGSNSMPVLGVITQQKSQGTPSLAATCWVLTHFCGVAESQVVIRVRPAEFIRPKQTKIGPGEGRALHCSGTQGKNGPCPRATQLSLS